MICFQSPFFQWFARLDLRTVIFSLRAIGIQVHQHGVRHTGLSAQDYCHVVVRQRIQERQRDGDLLIIQHYEPDILDRDAFPLVGGFARVDNHLPVAQAQTVWSRKKQDSFQHGVPCLNFISPVAVSSKSYPSTYALSCVCNKEMTGLYSSFVFHTPLLAFNSLAERAS